MKRRVKGGEEGFEERLAQLSAILARLDEPEVVRAFLLDLCTPAELEAMTDRWHVVPLLQQGVPYREIYELTGVSVTTIGRVARTLERGAGGYARAVVLRASTSERASP